MTLRVERAPWTPPALDEEIIYPDSDGMGMPDGDLQREVMIEVVKILQRRYAADPNVYVTGDIFVYYVEGNPSAVFSPDAMVVKGVPKRQRDNYMLWEEGDHVPDFILGIAARSTYKKDLYEKKGLYRLLGVQEYVLFDHTGGEYFQPPLQGYRLVEGWYEPIGNGMIVQSEVLGVEFRVEEGRLRLYDADTGEYLPPPDEALQAAEARTAELEAEVARLQAQLARLHGDDSSPPE